MHFLTVNIRYKILLYQLNFYLTDELSNQDTLGRISCFKNYGEFTYVYLVYRDWKWDKSGAKLIENHLKHEKKYFHFLLHTF